MKIAMWGSGPIPVEKPANKPEGINLACGLIWASLALYVAKSGASALSAVDPEVSSNRLVVLAVMATLYALLVMRVSAGKNWARIALITWFAVMFPFHLSEYGTSLMGIARIGGVIVAGEDCLELFALVLLFTGSASRWFGGSPQMLSAAPYRVCLVWGGLAVMCLAAIALVEMLPAETADALANEAFPKPPQVGR